MAGVGPERRDEKDGEGGRNKRRRAARDRAELEGDENRRDDDSQVGDAGPLSGPLRYPDHEHDVRDGEARRRRGAGLGLGRAAGEDAGRVQGAEDGGG